jgi:hypothetical protein
LLACVPALGLVLAASVGTASAARAPVSNRAELRTTIEHLLAHWHHTNYALGVGLKKVTTHNWSGYADDNTGGAVYSSLSGKWKEPTVSSCATAGAVKAVVFWVGIDGFNSQTVEQGGTGAICGGGTPLTYFSWWEMFPTNNIQVVGATVKPGDQISASVVRTGANYVIKVTDSTTAGNSFTTAPQACATCVNSSAEWIGEAPSSATGELQLPKFTPWTVTAATVAAGAVKGTISKFPDNAVTMENTPAPDNDVKPGALNAAGNSFKDTQLAT